MAPSVQEAFAAGFSAIVPDFVSTVFLSEFVFSFRYGERQRTGSISNFMEHTETICIYDNFH